MKSSIIVGINRTQDASIAIINEDQSVFAICKERITGLKHDWGKLGDLKLYKNAMKDLDSKVKILVECYSSDEERKRESEYWSEFKNEMSLTDDFRHIKISHHLAHLYSCYFPSRFEDASVLIVDFQGSFASDFTEDYNCLLYTSPSPRDGATSRMPSSA